MAALAMVLRAIGGAIALFYGRRVFWLFVATVGFLVGFLVGQKLFPGTGQLVHILVGIGSGLLGALLGQLAPSVVCAIVGFFAGGAALVTLIGGLIPLVNVVWWILFSVGGLVGACLAIQFFDLALVILSSFSGAGTLAALGGELLKYRGTVQTIIFIVLAAIGIVFQLRVVQPAQRQGQ